MNEISELIPHGICLSSAPWIIAARVVEDSIIAFVYLAIPFRLWLLLGKLPGRAYVFSPVLKLFAAFILFCGLSHVGDVVTMYVGGYAYVIDAIERTITAIFSLAALVAVIQAQELGVRLMSVFVASADDARTE